MEPKQSELQDLYGLDFSSLLKLTASLGGGPKMAAQLMRSLYADRPRQVEEIRGVRLEFLRRLAAVATIGQLTVARELPSAEAEPTTKYILAGADGAEFETVVIPARDRCTLCVSSQVGCRMGCAFCQTGKLGLVRNLTAAEIVEQVVFARSRLPAGRSLTNVVYMGMGEPLDNFDAVWRSYTILQEQRGLAIPRNRITISSAGYLPGLERLAMQGVPVSLALSLNASSDAIRSEIMPVNRPWPIERLMDLADGFPRRPDRAVMLEYVLFDGINDSEADVERLAELLGSRKVKVNVIAYNPVPGLPFRRPPPDRVETFAASLAARGIWTMVRESRGTDVMGACGQLGHDSR
ncbi:MAG: 23S rRNA (adenine(2503)-C(2))-methyltransferase RlmN [Candidatus Wallbacteria bacterium]|nr:23S rRNA (adenine(2503)-C(2))-methyltransferase RlmN [Candidatus Wallbacteria bacterium]